tara:strand:- start:159 stop:596 length:438 start_codon:yes stop_codon:yes gene_type:complete
MSSELDELNIETEKNLNLKKQDWLVIEEDSEAWQIQLQSEKMQMQNQNEQELIDDDIEAYSAWHHQSQLDQQQREAEERAIQPSTRELIERLNSAIAILDVIDPQIQGITDQLLGIRDRLKKAELDIEQGLADELAALARRNGIL